MKTLSRLFNQENRNAGKEGRIPLHGLMASKVIPFLFCLTLLARVSFAGPTEPLPTPAVGSLTDEFKLVLEGAFAAKQIDATAYATYCYGLGGQTKFSSASFGYGLAVLYPVTQYAYIGARLDAFDRGFYLGSASAGLKANLSIPLFGKTFLVTPFIEAGARTTISGGNNGQVSALIGTGFAAPLYQSKDGKFIAGVLAAMDYDSAYSGVKFFHGGPFVQYKW